MAFRMNMHPLAYVAIAVVTTLVLWKLNMLPVSISARLFMYVPEFVGKIFAPDIMAMTPTSSAPPADAAAQQQQPSSCQTGVRCESLVDEAQCGICKDGCEWLKGACHTRNLTPDEQK